jgi:hypothetical protein
LTGRWEHRLRKQRLSTGAKRRGHTKIGAEMGPYPTTIRPENEAALLSQQEFV